MKYFIYSVGAALSILAGYYSFQVSQNVWAAMGISIPLIALIWLGSVVTIEKYRLNE